MRDPESTLVCDLTWRGHTSAVRRFREEEGGDWPMLLDDDGRIAVDFGVAGVPESYLISPEGVVVSKIVGGILDGELEELLNRAKAGRSP